MTNKEIRDLIQRACDELIPRGVEHAWDHIDGSALKWNDLLSLANSVVKDEPISVEPVKGKNKVAVIADEATNGTV